MWKNEKASTNLHAWSGYLKVKMTKAEFANQVARDKAVHNEPPHLDLHYLPEGVFDDNFS